MMANRRIQRLGFAFGAVLLVTILWARLFSTPDTGVIPAEVADPVALATPEATADLSGPEPTPTVTADRGAELEGRGRPVDAAIDPDTRTYAVSTFELQGLPPDAAPGTRLELWVAWEPPIVDTPRFQKLLREVVIEKIVPGLTPEAPATALLQVSVKQIADLLYADRWGALSVAVLG